MSNQEIKGIFIDVENQEIKKLTIKNKLKEFYKILKCDSIECPTRSINGVKVIIVCDGEGALKEDNIPTIIGLSFKEHKFKEFIYGNVFICKFDGIDDFASLSENEINKILSPSIIIIEVLKKDGSKKKYLALSEDLD